MVNTDIYNNYYYTNNYNDIYSDYNYNEIVIITTILIISIIIDQGKHANNYNNLSEI